MASVSSSAARSLIRDGKSAVNLLLRVRTGTANLSETVQNNGPAIRSLLRLNQKPASQYPVFPKTFPLTQTGLRVGVFQQEEDVLERIGKMEAAHGKRVVNKNEDVDTEEEEEETDFDEDEIDDIDIDEDDEEFEDIDEDDEDEEEEKDPKYTRKKK